MARSQLIRSAGITAFAAVAVASAALLGACGTDSADTTRDADAISVSQPWVKAADSGMTAAFGVLENSTGSDVRLVSASSDVADSVEPHEVIDEGGTTTMRAKAGGFVIPANGSLTLDPGGEHLMFMGLKKPIRAGDSVRVTVRFADGSTTNIDAIARDFDGNQENYAPSEHK
ncbi:MULTISPECIES: copper chaperone PCu(A)C [Gordonia]|jgi:copper(I)-binding protein|uniref:Copper chaperone PCu(A)C n=1 Tax=Gordonia malaquae NBRC 108250 TaxID=1223542 RepID=M3V0B5_GORML|nr:copper chaperone PCu(A)C [Gordonia malaquae]GAC81867.1 hypothetical protein GM1_048_00140 [Gordonia malaquae NBRC 108250]SEC03393.1 hypothetical protein SAMN04488550_1200 [Gordonia malaquae]